MKGTSQRESRVLVFNFLGGVIERGIPLYARDITEAIRRAGFVPLELTCPLWLRRAPRPIRNAAFLIFEQVVAPIVRLARRCMVTVYPYNSVGIIDAALNRSVLIVHDILSNQRNNSRPAALYIRATQRLHTKLGRPVCAASEHTLKHLRRLQSFRSCPLTLWSNPFYSFERMLAQSSSSLPDHHPPRRVLLCSGMGRNKDYSGALRLFRRSNMLRHAELRIVGFGDDAHLAERRVALLREDVRKRITVLPRLTLAQLTSEYLSSDLVWVHSNQEGFGRWIVEARLCGRPVVASRIGAFRAFAPLGVAFYRDIDFDDAVEAAVLQNREAPIPDLVAYHIPLEAAVRNLLSFIELQQRGRKTERLTQSLRRR